jgi:predicted DNA-binding transcriptional regulator AlpA
VSPLFVTKSDVNQIQAQPSDETRLWDANDVARYIGASRSWVYHQAEAGRLPCIRILGFLRFDPQVVRAFVQAASSAPATVKNRAAVVASPGDTGR